MVDGVNFSRVSGLVSGMDIDGIVKKLMDAEKIPLNRITGQKTKLMWKQDAIRDLNLKIKTFIDGTSSMRLQGTFGMFKTTSTDSSVVTAQGTPTGSDSTAQFKNISQLASSASTFTSNLGGLDGNPLTKIDPNAVMSSVAFSSLPPASGSFTINALQKDGSFKNAVINFDSTVDSLNAVLGRINAAGIGVTAFYDSGSDKIVMSTNASGQDTSGKALQLLAGSILTTTFGLSDADGKNAIFNLNGVSTSRQSNTFTVNGIQYNLLKTTGIAASTTTASPTGIAAAGTVVNPNAVMSTVPFSTAPTQTSGNFIVSALQADGTTKSSGLINYDTTVDSINDVINRINSAGINVTASFDSNTNKITIKNNINGKGNVPGALQIVDASGNLLSGSFGLSTADGVDSPTTNVTATRDVDGLVDKVKDFITKYNTMLDTLNGKLNEPKYRSYQPLTDEQKSVMKDADIKLWEDKAKSGLLSGDSTLERAIYGFRNEAYATVAGVPTGALDQLNSIGITTDLYQSGGKLIINDESKLRDALSQKPDQVMALFTNHNVTDPTKDGIAWKLYNRANDTIKDFTKIGGSGTTRLDDSQISKSIKDMNDKIDNLNRTLSTKESRYYAKFTAMEKAMNQLQQQSASLISKMGGG